MTRRAFSALFAALAGLWASDAIAASVQPPGPQPTVCGGGLFVQSYGAYGSTLTCASGLASGAVNTGGPQALAGYTASGVAISPLTVGTKLSVSGGQLNVDLSGLALSTRLISTVGCLTGGGDLSADRTVSISSGCIANSLLLAMPAATFKGSIAGGAPADLTATQATALLNPMVGDSGSGGTKGLVPAPASGDAAAQKFLHASGGWSVPPGSGYNPAAVSITGGTITGTLVTGLPTPSAAADAATKQYVDAVSLGTIYHTQVSYATAAALPNTPTYSNGASGVGATLTSATNTALVVDSVTVSVLTTRVAVKNQAAPAENGIYTLTQAGTGSVPWILTRAGDFNMATAGEIDTNAYFFVGLGTVNAGTAWVMNTPTPIAVGSTGLTFIQSAGNTAYTAGSGLTLAGNAFSLTAPVTGALGGTGVANSGKTITLSGNLSVTGGFNVDLIAGGNVGLTIPGSGTAFLTSGIPTCSAGDFNTSGAGAFTCATPPSAGTYTLGPNFTTAIGSKTGTLSSGSTLYSITQAKSFAGNHTVDLTDIGFLLVFTDGTNKTATLPAATASANNVGSPYNGLCFYGTTSGFTVSASNDISGGMPGVPAGNSFTFSAKSYVCAAVNAAGTAWELRGYHGTIPTSQLPVIANGHVIGQASGSSGFARDVTVVAGTGISISAASDNLTITATGTSGDTTASSLTALGTQQSNCLALTAQQNQVTGGAAGTAVCLFNLTVGGHASVYNDTVTDKLVCPFSGQKINNLTVTTGCYTLPANMSARFESPTSAGWYSIP